MPKSNTAVERHAQRRAAVLANSGPFNPDQVFTIEEAAELLKVSTRRMRRWVYNGSMGYVLLPGGRGRRVTGAHLNQAMAAGDRTPDAA